MDCCLTSTLFFMPIPIHGYRKVKEMKASSENAEPGDFPVLVRGSIVLTAEGLVVV